MATFINTRAAIKTKLQEVTLLAYVYDYHNSNLEGFPAITFDVSEATDDFLTNAENIRKVSWQIVIYQELTDRGLSAANALLDAATDAVIAKLEGNSSLGGVVDYSSAVAGRRETIETPNGLARAQYLTLSTVWSALV